jgi:hypothetical protein
VQERSPEAWSEALRAVALAGTPADEVRAYASAFGWDDVVQRQCALYEAVAQGRAGAAVQAALAGAGGQGAPWATPSRA